MIRVWLVIIIQNRNCCNQTTMNGVQGDGIANCCVKYETGKLNFVYSRLLALLMERVAKMDGQTNT